MRVYIVTDGELDDLQKGLELQKFITAEMADTDKAKRDDMWRAYNHRLQVWIAKIREGK